MQEFAQCALSPAKLRLALYPSSLMYICIALCMHTLLDAHLVLYLFHNLLLFQVFLEDTFSINPFSKVLCQSYIILPLIFLNVSDAPFIIVWQYTQYIHTQ